MQVQQAFWQNTNIQTILNIFTGKMAEQLVTATPEITENLNKHLHHIFRRWYFLSLSPTEESSAADMLEYYKTIEKWPKNGQFLIRPQLVQRATKIDIELDVDYILFTEQPLLIDVRKRLSGQKQDLFFPYDEVYKNLVQRVVKTLQTLGVKTLGDKGFTIQELQAVWSATITAICAMWMEFDPFIGNRFTLKEFIVLWEGFLKDAFERDVVIDDVMNTIVLAVRQTYPGWAYTIDELEKKEQQHMINRATDMVKKEAFNEMQTTTFYTLGLSLDRYFLTPLSLYLPLIRTHYTDLLCWEKDMKEALSHPKADIHYIFSDPCSAFRLTNFGEIVAKGVMQK